MFGPIWIASIHTRYFLRRYMPTNILLDLIRTRRGLKWGIPAMLLAVPYFLAAAVCVQIIEDGGHGWLNILVLLFVWNALKFLCIGPVSAALLTKARLGERRSVRKQQRPSGYPGSRMGLAPEDRRRLVDAGGAAGRD